MNPYLVGGLATLQLVTSLQQAELIRQQAQLSQQANEYNAQFAEWDAYDAEKHGATKSARYQSAIDASVADQTAAYAAQGVDVTFGTAAEVQSQTRQVGYLNQLDIMQEAHMRALGFKRQARAFRLGGQFAQSQGNINATATERQGLFRALQIGASGYEKGVGGNPTDASGVGGGYGSAGESYVDHSNYA